MANRIASIATLMFLSAGVLLCTGCTQLEKIDDGGSTEARIPTDVQAAFDRSCAFAGCHDAASATYAGRDAVTRNVNRPSSGSATVRSTLPGTSSCAVTAVG